MSYPVEFGTQVSLRGPGGPYIRTMPFSTRYDAVIAGSGHNGLVAAAYLANAGQSVLVLERNDWLGEAPQPRSGSSPTTMPTCRATPTS